MVKATPGSPTAFSGGFARPGIPGISRRFTPAIGLPGQHVEGLRPRAMVKAQVVRTAFSSPPLFCRSYPAAAQSTTNWRKSAGRQSGMPPHGVEQLHGGLVRVKGMGFHPQDGPWPAPSGSAPAGAGVAPFACGRHLHGHGALFRNTNECRALLDPGNTPSTMAPPRPAKAGFTPAVRPGHGQASSIISHPRQRRSRVVFRLEASASSLRRPQKPHGGSLGIQGSAPQISPSFRAAEKGGSFQSSPSRAPRHIGPSARRGGAALPFQVYRMPPA